MRRNWLGRSALVLLPAAAAGALTAVATQPSAAYQASPAYHVSSAFYAAPAAPVAAQLTASTESIGSRILDEAETRAGDWYVYGGAGPSVFDCSGLVYWASHKLGVNMPRTTYAMLSEGVSSGLLYQVSEPAARGPGVLRHRPRGVRHHLVAHHVRRAERRNAGGLAHLERLLAPDHVLPHPLRRV